MKSAYELAMERLGQQSPSRTLTAEQKTALAELDSVYRAKLAQQDLAFQDELRAAQAARDEERAETARTNFASDRRRLEADLEERKERVRSGG